MPNPLIRTLAAASLAGMAFTATAARAQDDEDASGPYVGVSAGYGWSTADATTTTTFDPAGYFSTGNAAAVNATGVQRVKPRGFSGGAQIGYDHHSGNFLIGAVADIASLGHGRTSAVTANYPTSTSTYTVSQSVDPKWMTTARLKLGLSVGTGSTVYATGGWAGTKVRFNSQFTDTLGTANETASSNKFRSGWVAGGGASIRMGGNWSLNPEYLHAEFGTMNVPGGTLTANTPTQSFPANAFNHTLKLRTDTARVALNYHF